MTELKLPEINRLLLAGRLTRDPDLRYAASGMAVTRFDLAFHRRLRARDGSLSETTGFITVNTYQRLAEVCAEYLRKGSPVVIEGKLQWREWKSPQGVKRSSLEIQADLVHFLERRPDLGPGVEEPVAGAAVGTQHEESRTRTEGKHGKRS